MTAPEARGPTTGRRAGGPRRRTLAGVALALVGAGLIGVLAARGASDQPLSPTSTGAAGTRAVVDVLGELGAGVRVGRPEPGEPVDAALVLVDDLGDDERAALEAAAAEGATVVVADPTSPLGVDRAATAGRAGFGPPPQPACDVAALERIGRVRADGAVFETGGDEVGCFPVGEGSWLVVTPAGDGHVVSVGGPGWLTNAELTRLDHAPLAAALLAPADEAEVLVVEPRDVLAGRGEGPAGLIGLVPGWAWAVLAQLGVAAAALIAWRARRLGRPVSEPQPASLPGSELVAAMGDLWQVTGAAAHAGRRLREDLAAELRRRLGFDADAPAEQLADAAADAGADPGQAHRALAGPLPGDDAALIALAGDVEAVRAAVAGEPAAADARAAGDVHAGA